MVIKHPADRGDLRTGGKVRHPLILLSALICGVLLGFQLSAASAQSPAPSPTAFPADLDFAREAAVLGRVDEAVGAYSAVIAGGSPAERLTARIGLAQLFIDTGDANSAIRQLDAYLIEAPLSTDVRSAQLLMAEAMKLASRYADAVALYRTYIAAQGPAPVYATMGLAESLAGTGDPTASAVGESILPAELPTSTRLRFIARMAQALERARPEEALTWYERLGSESDSSDDQALAIWKLASFGERVAAWKAVIERYPDSTTARDIVGSPLLRPGALVVDPYYTGLVYYQAGDTDRAEDDFRESLGINGNGGDNALAARSSFYLGVLDERAGNLSAAAARYQAVGRLDPDVDLADDALWWQGRIQEQRGRPHLAATAYRELISEYKGSGYRSEAAFRLALLDYDAGEFEGAAKAFEALSRSSDTGERQRAQLWQGKALHAAGERPAAESLWQSIAEEEPYGYYGLRAQVLLGDAEGSLRSATLSTPSIQWADLQAWLSATGAGDPAAAEQTFAADPHWRTAEELRALGMAEYASAEFNLVLQRSLGDPNTLLLLAERFQRNGQHDLSARAMTRLLADLPDEALIDAPPSIWNVAYPTPYATAFDDAAETSDVANVLLLAVVRQESFFDPLAGSPAGAIGLTQIIEPTALAIASDLELEGFAFEDLFRPAVSLDLGAHYLRRQLDVFDDSPYVALAAYNGGPENAQRWYEASDDDADRFVAEIEFPETEAYVQLVSEHLARYRQLLQGYDSPVLPRD